MDFLILLLLLLVPAWAQEFVIVDLPGLGSLRGREAPARNGDKFYSFRGVAFASPPVGDRRFKLPLPIEPWSGTRDALQYQQLCMQAPYADPTEVKYDL